MRVRAALRTTAGSRSRVGADKPFREPVRAQRSQHGEDDEAAGTGDPFIGTASASASGGESAESVCINARRVGIKWLLVAVNSADDLVSSNRKAMR